MVVSEYFSFTKYLEVSYVASYRKWLHREGNVGLLLIELVNK